MKAIGYMAKRCRSVLLPVLLASRLDAAVLATEEFSSDNGGWEGAGSMTVGHSGSEGNPAGSLQGSFAAQGFFIPQAGSFRIDGGTNFLGAYPGGDNLTGFTFDLMADSVLPLYVNLRLYSGAESYFHTLDISSLQDGVWSSFTVALSSPSWVGDATVLNNVTAVEVQFARNTSAQQYFYLDNFGTTDQDLGGGGGGGVVPEPSTGLVVIYFGAMLYGMRQRVRRRVQGRRVRG
jgi:hypothetical protein